MLTFKTTRIVFLIIFTLAIAEFLILKFPWYYLLQLPLLYFMILAYGSAFIQAGFFLKSITRADTNEKVIAFTFDDGPDPVQTPQILELLRAHEINATFFVIGSKIKGAEALLQEI